MSYIDYEDDDPADDDHILEEIDDDENEDVSLSRVMTLPALDGHVLQSRIDALPTTSPVSRTIVSEIQRMHQSLGDADASFADVAADIESSVRLLFMEFSKSPGTVLLGILSTMSSAEQLRHIGQIEDLLSQRKARIMTDALVNFYG